VLAFEPDETAQALDPQLATLTDELVRTERVKAWPLGSTSWTGLRNQGWRGWWRLRQAGNKLIEEFKPDLILFSTTVFNAFFHGVYWRRRWQIPFVLDLQDPWFNEHYKRNPQEKPPGGIKYHFASAVARFGERRVYPHAGGFMSVSAGYCEDLKRRFPQIRAPQIVLPFVPDEADWQWVRERREVLPATTLDPRKINIVMAGRGGRDMAPALNTLLEGISNLPERSGDCAVHLLGTAYTNRDQPRPQYEPEIEQWHELDVQETPYRLPYLESLRWMSEASINLILGSSDPRYSPSKFYNTLEAGRPTLVVTTKDTELHKLAQSEPGCFILLSGQEPAGSVLAKLDQFLRESPSTPFRAPAPTAESSAESSTRRQTEFFDLVLKHV